MKRQETAGNFTTSQPAKYSMSYNQKHVFWQLQPAKSIALLLRNIIPQQPYLAKKTQEIKSIFLSHSLFHVFLYFFTRLSEGTKPFIVLLIACDPSLYFVLHPQNSKLFK